MTYEIATIGDLGAPCSCGSSSSGMGDATSEAVAITSSGWLPTVVWPSDVDAYKRKLDPDFSATNSTASRCANLPAGEAMAWGEFFLSWTKFRDEGSCIFGCANKYEEARSFELRLHEWQKKLSETCKLNAPAINPEAGAPDTSGIKWIAAAVIVVGVAYIASPLITGAQRVARRR